MSAHLISLHSAEASLVFEQVQPGGPVWRHCGARVVPGDLPALAATRAPASFSLDTDVPPAMLNIEGSGWFGRPAVQCARRGQALALRPVCISSTASADQILARFVDAVAGVEITWSATVQPGGAIVFQSTISNTGDQPLDLIAMASVQFPLPHHAARILSWRGRHNAEFQACDEPMPAQQWVKQGRRGIPGHAGPPGVCILDEAASHDAGLVWSLQLAWSGDHRIAVDYDDEGYWLLTAEACPGAVGKILAPHSHYALPAAILAISQHGLNGAAAQHHDYIRRLHHWDKQVPARKIHLNSWEACYFAHDQARMRRLADAAAAVGAERFVLDDGWFRNRNDDRAGLGDWQADPVKYPDGLRPLGEYVQNLGMDFGLWVEPEMANPDSDLLRNHPDWVLGGNPGEVPTGRNQVVLDLGRADVRDFLFAVLDDLLSTAPIAYLKWDHNRDLVPAGGFAQVEGLYELMERLRRAHPGVEIESCAGGGGRIDAGIAAFCQRFWTSDNIDALSRVSMQRCFLQFFPPEMMGSHVGASPAHATGRSQPLAFRAAVAMPGHFGIELDPAELTATERDELQTWTADYKHWRWLLHGSMVHQGKADDGLVWHAHIRAGEFLLFVTRMEPALRRRPQPLRLPFLASDQSCSIRLARIAGGKAGHAMHLPDLHRAMMAAPVMFSGSWLARSGLPLPPLKAETVAIFHGHVQ